MRLPIWCVTFSLLGFSSGAYAATIDPARSQALLKTLQSPEASLYEKARACQQAGEFGSVELVPALAALLGDGKLSAYARSGLENIPGDEASAALRDALGRLEGDLLAGVIDSVADRRDTAAVPALSKLAAADPRNGVAGRALTALGSIADDAAIELLCASFMTARDELCNDVASALLLAAQRRLSAGDAAAAVRVCDELLARKLPPHLNAAAVHGGVLARGIGDTGFLVRMLVSDDRGVRNAARLAASGFPPQQLTKVLSDALDAAAEDRKPLLDETLQALCFRPLITGRHFYGWEGETKKSFRREEEAIVGGGLNEAIPRNEFLATTRPYTNFILRAECRLVGEKVNAGIQFRTERIPNHHEVKGYQADMSTDKDGGYWGKLYDESRRKKVLGVTLNHAEMMKNLRQDGWNQYEIRCEGPRIQLFLNGVKTLDYVEGEPSIPRHGIIALQIHSGPPSEAWYRNVRIAELP